MLQGIEDFPDPKHHREGTKFLSGDGFKICGEPADMNFLQQIGLLLLLKCSIRQHPEPAMKIKQA